MKEEILDDSGIVDCTTLPKKKRLLLLFLYFMKIAVFVVGGGYAIIAAAEDVFEQKLRWLRQGELIDMLPMFQSIPGLIAGNSAMYVGWKVAGFFGAMVSLLAVALPSFIIILFVSYGFSWLPMDNTYVQGAFIGVRSALAGVVAATVIKSWKRIMHGAYAALFMPITLIGIVIFKISAAFFLVLGICIGIVAMLITLPQFRKHSKVTKEVK